MKTYSAVEGLDKLISETETIIEMRRHDAKRSREYAAEEEAGAVVLERTLADLRSVRLSVFGHQGDEEQ